MLATVIEVLATDVHARFAAKFLSNFIATAFLLYLTQENAAFASP